MRDRGPSCGLHLSILDMGCTVWWVVHLFILIIGLYGCGGLCISRILTCVVWCGLLASQVSPEVVRELQEQKKQRQQQQKAARKVRGDPVVL